MPAPKKKTNSFLLSSTISKKNLLSIVLTVLMALVALAAIYSVSAKLSMQNSVAPNAPDGELLAACKNDDDCGPKQECKQGRCKYRADGKSRNKKQDDGCGDNAQCSRCVSVGCSWTRNYCECADQNNRSAGSSNTTTDCSSIKFDTNNARKSYDDCNAVKNNSGNNACEVVSCHMGEFYCTDAKSAASKCYTLYPCDGLSCASGDKTIANDHIYCWEKNGDAHICCERDKVLEDKNCK